MSDLEESHLLQTGIDAYQLGNYPEAFRILLPLAKAGDMQAQSSVASMYDLGLGVEPNELEAMNWYNLAAQQGHPVAQHNLGELYYAQEKFAQAVQWYRQAAEKNFPFALDALGEMYLRGLGVPKDEQEAARLYHQAADQGFLFAQHNLAQMYAQGKGVAQNWDEAIKLYQLAANQGYGISQKVLAQAYEQGLLGLTPDREKAAYWFSKVQEND